MIPVLVELLKLVKLEGAFLITGDLGWEKQLLFNDAKLLP